MKSNYIKDRFNLVATGMMVVLIIIYVLVFNATKALRMLWGLCGGSPERVIIIIGAIGLLGACAMAMSQTLSPKSVVPDSLTIYGYRKRKAIAVALMLLAFLGFLLTMPFNAAGGRYYGYYEKADYRAVATIGGKEQFGFALALIGTASPAGVMLAYAAASVRIDSLGKKFYRERKMGKEIKALEKQLSAIPDPGPKGDRREINKILDEEAYLQNTILPLRTTTLKALLPVGIGIVLYFVLVIMLALRLIHGSIS